MNGDNPSGPSGHGPEVQGFPNMDKEEVIAKMLTNMEELKQELDYLRWFHANCPIPQITLTSIQDAYTEMGNVVPVRWWLISGDSNENS